jgi:hypothetical protein
MKVNPASPIILSPVGISAQLCFVFQAGAVIDAVKDAKLNGAWDTAMNAACFASTSDANA